MTARVTARQKLDNRLKSSVIKRTDVKKAVYPIGIEKGKERC